MTVKTITKGITFEQAMKLFKKFVSKSKTRPVLQLVYYNGTHLVATDSHQLLRINTAYISDFPTNKESFYYDPKKNEYVDYEGNYPQTDRLIPDWSNSTIELNNNFKDFYTTIKEAKKHVKKDKVIKIEFTKNHATISGNHYTEKEDSSGVPKETIETYTNTLENVMTTGEEIKIHLNATYLLNSLDVVKKFSKLSNDTPRVEIIGAFRPIHITITDIFDCVVLPVRTY